jgi:hypothetical protein
MLASFDQTGSLRARRCGSGHSAALIPGNEIHVTCCTRLTHRWPRPSRFGKSRATLPGRQKAFDGSTGSKTGSTNNANTLPQAVTRSAG